jgi:hypothetical protein
VVRVKAVRVKVVKAVVAVMYIPLIYSKCMVSQLLEVFLGLFLLQVARWIGMLLLLHGLSFWLLRLLSGLHVLQ